MRNAFLTLTLLCLFFTACRQEKAAKIDPASRTKVALRSFSDTTTLDTFKIVLNGDKPKEMELVFTITTPSGKNIYTKILKATALLDNYKDNVDLGKEKKQVQFLEDELGLFLDEENFLEPAVTADELPDKNTPDKIFFGELKKSGLNGFKYRLGKESNVYIAWSDKEQKVKPYYECCR
ncbi:hypothetical protein SAMN06265348_102364 [Pedobacter westerhofensis]|uniref:Lipoprotein n=1 Tax=Pedobacter westerhofensis TaxID=425512 RepID=A0A521BK17_9SPHI|nr:hypothetical protein [Pedobacter westerhofensis]SMO47416.1 hypothetical protein SAMN06265348_102364 [Pedobacter westerhofensis]